MSILFDLIKKIFKRDKSYKETDYKNSIVFDTEINDYKTECIEEHKSKFSNYKLIKQPIMVDDGKYTNHNTITINCDISEYDYNSNIGDIFNNKNLDELIELAYDYLLNFDIQEYKNKTAKGDNNGIIIPVLGRYNKEFYSSIKLLGDVPIAMAAIPFSGRIEYYFSVDKDDFEMISLITNLSLFPNAYETEIPYLAKLREYLCNLHPVFKLSKYCFDNENDIGKVQFDKVCEIKQKYNNLREEIRKHWNVELPKVVWRSEKTLYSFVKLAFDDAIYQYKYDSSSSQSFDIFIPSINCAIEYQGVQHYHKDSYYGNEYQKELDEKKRTYCKRNNIKLLEWSYIDKVRFQNFYTFCEMEFPDKKFDIYFFEKALDKLIGKKASELLEVYNICSSKEKLKSQKKAKPSISIYIAQYSKNGLLINVYDNYEEPSKKYNVSIESIKRAVSGRYKTTANFQWRKYKLDDVNKVIEEIEPLEQIHKESVHRKVLQISLDGEYINEYDSIAEASKISGVSNCGISKTISGVQKTSGGYIWRSV